MLQKVDWINWIEWPVFADIFNTILFYDFYCDTSLFIIFIILI